MDTGQRQFLAALAALTSGYALLSFSGPLLYHLRLPDQAVYAMGRTLCHQQPSRCLWIFGAQTVLCAKCTGFYLTSALYCAFAIRCPAIALSRWVIAFPVVVFLLTLTHSFTNNLHGNAVVAADVACALGVVSAPGAVGVLAWLYNLKGVSVMEWMRSKFWRICLGLAVLHVAMFARAALAQEEAKSVLVPAGTPVILEMMSGISAKETREGDTLMLRVRVPVKVQGQVVVNAGVLARGMVTLSRSASCWGGAGELQIDARSVSAVDGTELTLGGSAGRRGETSHGTSAAVAVGAGLICLPLALAGAAVKGEEGEIRPGYEIVARTLNEVAVRIPSEEERQKILQEQTREGDAAMQRIQEERQAKEEAEKRKKRQEEDRSFTH